MHVFGARAATLAHARRALGEAGGAQKFAAEPRVIKLQQVRKFADFLATEEPLDGA